MSAVADENDTATSTATVTAIAEAKARADAAMRTERVEADIEAERHRLAAGGNIPVKNNNEVMTLGRLDTTIT